MAINSKNKGNTFERKIANLLSARFLTQTGIEQSFRRDVTSGSFFGATNQKRLETHDVETATFGDIMAPANFNFSIECKHYKTPPTFTSMMKQDCKMISDWIAQAVQDATNSGKMMLVIAKFNNVADFVIIDGHDDDALMMYRGYAIIPLTVWLARPDTYFFS
jgi:hypothetical protein